MSEILNILGTVGFNWHVALANFFNFLIILFLLQKFFFAKIRSTIEKRANIIEEGLNNAEVAANFLQQAETEKEKIVHNAKNEAKSILESAHTEGEEAKENLRKNAEEEISSRYQVLVKEEENIQARVENDFMKKAPLLVAKLYEKTMGEVMTEDKNNAFIANIKV